MTWTERDVAAYLNRAKGKAPDRRITERQFMTQVMRIGTQLGWTFYHPWTSINSAAGFPDLVLVTTPAADLRRAQNRHRQVDAGTDQVAHAIKRL